MKKYIILLSLLVVTFGAFAQKQFVVDPNAEMRTLSGSFHSILVSGGIDLYVSQSGKEEVAVSSSDEKLISGIKTVVENNTLRIYYDGERGWNKKDRHLRAYVSVSTLQRLEASGASDVQFTGTVKVPSLKLKMSGASDFSGDLSVESLNVELTGASDASITGNAKEVIIDCSGASDVNGYGFTADQCTAKASGASDVFITVNTELNAHASGASSVIYKGNAVLKEIQSSGASTVSKKK